MLFSQPLNLENSLFSEILMLCSEMHIFNFGVSLGEFCLFSLSERAPLEQKDRRLAPGLYLLEWEVFGTASHLSGLCTDKTCSSCLGSPEQTWLVSAQRPLDLGELPWLWSSPVGLTGSVAGVPKVSTQVQGLRELSAADRIAESSNQVSFCGSQVYVLD